jgi:N-dimethylarginine dimethylaminohydrolase
VNLPWGRRFLMCPPSHYQVLYEINPWMHREVAVDLDRAHQQWQGLVGVLQTAGAEIELLEPRAGLPDLVFTANAGTVNSRTLVPSRFRHPQRQPEVEHDVDWFRSQGFTVSPLPASVVHEGAGDCLPVGRVFLSGYRYRSEAAAHAPLAARLGAEVLPVELVDARMYHLDLTLCPLDGRRALVAPQCWDRYGRRVVERLVPEPLVLEDDEVTAFCANSVVVGSTVVMPACPPRLGRQLEVWGFEVAVVDVGEFRKAGGGPRCLTLALDVVIPPPLGPPG